MQQHHAACPVAATTVPPQGPRHLGQLGMPRLRPEVGEALLKRRVGAVARVAPHLAVVLLRLLVRRGQERAFVLPRQRLPVQVVRAGQPRLARALAATVLVDDDPAQGLHTLGNPDRVIDREDQFTRLRGSLIAHPVVGWFGRREDIIRRLLSVQVGRTGDEKEETKPAEFGGEVGHGSNPPENERVAGIPSRATGPVGFRGKSYFLCAARSRCAAPRNRANGYAYFWKRYPGTGQQDS